jgi:hypothetical protein
VTGAGIGIGDDIVNSERGLRAAQRVGQDVFAAFIHTIRDYDSSSANTSTFGVYHNDWTPKPAVEVIEDVIEENEAIIAAEEAQSAAADETNL